MKQDDRSKEKNAIKRRAREISDEEIDRLIEKGTEMIQDLTSQSATTKALISKYFLE